MTAGIHPRAIVEEGAEIGEGVEIAPFVHVGAHVRLHDRVKLHPHAVVLGHTEVGEETEIMPFAVLGTPPQHLSYKGEPTTLKVGRRNQIREHVTMNPGTVQGGGETVVGDDCLFMVGAHIAHDCILGDRIIMANNATLGGHIHIGDGVFISGLVAIHQFSRIGNYAFVGGGAIVTGDIIPYGSVFGNRAKLEGLNIVGMKRRGMPRKTIHAIRAAYRMLFAPEGTLQERIDDCVEAYGEVPEVMEMVTFMRAAKDRSLCLPGQ
ncbi:acyl-ACP--UDP-N-acetylglucosamine O-acyltransferase [Parvularcula maris]|uniref:Acyl-[acyl-carrier-protein]--UDP-N-acetylglucosamine O-acyltransferase n=1 Tax=Parvularcula maris TaxID=2965077 RepID=A0A9X2L9T1_9PROT|nr:acyl-ACP--UDP-N-acetylglucosamine O-acyltransferase [Parvularcula maris]MCQ8185548.1 acyl-ACP--UDP-N-acetylglucosamine O-acyltransferase [Parvularcula maris]